MIINNITTGCWWWWWQASGNDSNSSRSSINNSNSSSSNKTTRVELYLFKNDRKKISSRFMNLLVISFEENWFLIFGQTYEEFRICFFLPFLLHLFLHFTSSSSSLLQQRKNASIIILLMMIILMEFENVYFVINKLWCP